MSLLRSVVLLGAFAPAVGLGVTPAELQGRLARSENVLIVDVRPASAFGEGHIPGAINISAALLPYKQLPTAAPIVVCGDGVGGTHDEEVLQLLRRKPGVTADVLEGGYAAWLAATRVTTAPAGVARERLPGITYAQVLTAPKQDMVLVDVRPVAAAASTKRAVGAMSTATTVADPVATFAGKIGVPVVGPSPVSASRARAMSSGVVASQNTESRRSVVESLDGANKLLVLVADDEAQAILAARELRARGNYRFTILIGGTEAIRHEGKTGSSRMTGADVEVTPEPSPSQL